MEDIDKYNPDNLQIENYYLVTGFRRSGNHFLITLIIANFKKDEVLLLVNPLRQAFKQGKILENFEKDERFGNGIFWREKTKEFWKGAPPEFFDAFLKKDDAINLVKNGGKIKCVIMNLEDLAPEEYKKGDIFKNVTNKFTVFCFRDILNVVASRLRTNELQEQGIDKRTSAREVPHKGVKKYFIDIEDWWVEMFEYALKHPEIIVFNYNKFLLSKKYRHKLYKKLHLDKKITDDYLDVVPGFGGGSSFSDAKNKEENEKYLTRWKEYVNHPKIKQLLEDEKIVEILKDHFEMKL